MQKTKMKTKHRVLAHLCLLFFGFLQSCILYQNNSDKLGTYDQYRKQHLQYRDSLFIFYTVQRWNDSNFDVYEDLSRMYKISNDQISYFTGGAFYSPDKLKIIVWEGEKKPNAATLTKYYKDSLSNRICPNGGDTVYNLRVVIGFRSDTNSFWKLYPFNDFLVGCGDSTQDVITEMCKFYFRDMKNTVMYQTYQTGDSVGYLESKPYGYNLQDKYFWDKCWLWQKDTVGANGLYQFQINGYRPKDKNGVWAPYGRCYKCAIEVVLPKIVYPDSILKMFGNAR